MGLKYRIRLHNDRIIGPFTSEEVGELFMKNHIDGNEHCQHFPIGDWKPLKNYPELVSIIRQAKRKLLTSNKIELPKEEKIAKPIKQEKTNSSMKEFNEFKYERKQVEEVDYSELEKKYSENNQSSNPKAEEEIIKTQNSLELKTDSDDNIQKTRVINNFFSKKENEIEKTLIVPSKQLAKIKEENKEIHEESENKSVTISKKINTVEQLLPTKADLENEKTEFINLAQVLPSINAQLSVSEVELDQKAKIEENNEKIRLREEMALEQFEDSDDIEIDELDSHESNLNNNAQQTLINKKKKKKKKGMSLIIALAFVGVFYLLLSPDETPKKSGPQFTDIKFPITQEYEDQIVAEQNLKIGRDLYAKNTYLAKKKSTGSYLVSLQKKFSNNEAIGDLILTYTELLDDTKDRKTSAHTIYKLIQLSENKMLSDLNVVMGTALFYGKIGKYETGINVIKNYLRTKKLTSSKLLAYYLDLLISSGNLVEAKSTYNALNAIPKKTIEAYLSIARFNEIDEHLDEALKNIEEGLKSFPQSAVLQLKEADYLLKEKNLKKYEAILKKCFDNKAEDSPSYTAKLYYHMGILSAQKGKTAEASKFFKASLNLNETDELRSLLSSLEIGGDKLSQNLILESKVLDLIKKAKAEIKNKNLETAFALAIEAVDALPDNIPAIILLSQLQVRRGLFESAIISLQKAIANNPTNYTLKKNLIQTYLKSFKFEDAQKILTELSQTKYSLGSEYASLEGDLYQASSNLPLAVKWYIEALNRDALSDYDMYQLAKIFLRTKKFLDAKNRLAKAINLDPKNPEYLSTYAEILFEQDNTDVAIGYIRDAISEIGEAPKLLSTIAILYHRSGQIKEFENYYKKIQELPKKDETFFEFLIYAAKLEDRKDDFINYSRELLKVNPGNLKIRIELGETFYKMKRYQEAVAEFEEVVDKLNSYPKAHYMLAKVYLAMNDSKKAKALAMKEMELNPNLDSSYFIVGEVAKQQNDYREAITKYEKAISLNPKSVEALMSLAWIRLAQNYASEAIELYSRALKEDKSNPEIFKQLGYSFKAAGQRNQAKENFENYQKLSPGASDHEQIQLLIKNLQ